MIERLFGAQPQTTMIVSVVGGVVIVVLMFFYTIARRWVKVGPNEVLIVSGGRHKVRNPDGTVEHLGYRIRKGGGTFVWPIIEQVQRLLLEVMTLNVTTPEVYSIQGVPVTVEGVAQVKVGGDDVSIRTAAEQFLSKRQDETLRVALQTIEGHLRAIIGTLTVEEIYRDRQAFAQKVQEVAGSDLANMGLVVVSFTIRDVRDTQGYLDAIGKPRIAMVKRDAIIGEAEAQRDATIKSAQANMAGQVGKFEADSKVAEAQRDYEINVATYQMLSRAKKAEADLAYDLQKFKVEQEVTKERVGVEIAERTRQIELEQQEIARKEKELTATVQKPAEAERFRIQQLAEAEQYRLRATAEGESDRERLEGEGEAAAVRAKGLAAAEVVKATGFSEAEAMTRKAEAWRLYNEAAITQIFLDKLPEIAAAISAPLSKMERMVVVSMGDGHAGGTGAARVTQDVTSIIAQLPAVIEALTGMKMDDLLSKLPKLKGTIEPPASIAPPPALKSSSGKPAAPPPSGGD